MVFDLRELKEILNQEVVDPMDHSFLNREVPPFDCVVPTTRTWLPRSGADWSRGTRGRTCVFTTCASTKPPIYT